jgi:hypothetical protein
MLFSTLAKNLQNTLFEFSQIDFASLNNKQST